MKGLFYYIPPAPNGEWLNVNKAHNTPVTTYLSFKTINRNNHFHFQSLSFLCEITEPLLIISKSIQFELCHI